MITYQKIHKKYIPQITKIWESGLVDNIYSVLGRLFIKDYLNLIFRIKKNKTFIAFDKRKKKVVGFVIFGSENQINSKILYKNSVKILIIFFKKIILFQIKDLLKFIDILVYLVILQFYKIDFKKSIELLIIVVEDTHRSKNIGKKLINKSISSLKKESNQLKYINVVTLTKLKRSIDFYKKNRFKIKKKVFNRYHLLRKI